MTSGPALRETARTAVLRTGRPTGERVRLSVYDLVNGTFATQRTFFYRQTLDTDALRESLRRTLEEHPMLTGRLRRDEDGGLSVLCDDAGAAFGVRHRDGPMPEYGPGRRAGDDLRRYVHIVNPFRVVGHDVPLLTVRVTHFGGGGSVLGVCINHSVTDGAGYLDFLLHWSRTHRGLAHRPAPYSRRLLEGLTEGAAARARPDDPQYTVVTGRRKWGFLWRLNAGAHRMRTLTVRLGTEDVLALRRAAAAGPSGPARVSGGDALGAHLWRVLAGLRDRAPDSTERLGMVVSLRPALADLLPQGYAGNAVSNTTAALPARALREEPLAHAAAAVRDARERVTADRVRAEMAFLRAQHRAGHSKRVFSRMALDSFEDTVALNNVGRLPVYDIEFGTGRPFWFEFPATPIPWTVLITPTPEDGHSRDVHLSVPRAAAEALESPRWAERLRMPE